MYSLVALLSILAWASFVLAFVRGRRQLPLLGVWLALLLYTHTWGLSWPRRWPGVARAVARGRGAGRAARGSPRARADLRAVAADARSPRPPTRARPGPSARRRCWLLGIPCGLFGHFAVPLLALAVFAALRRDRRSTAPCACWRGSRSPPPASRGWARRSSRRGRTATWPSCSARCCWRSPRSSRAAPLDGGRAGRRRRRVADRGPPPTKSNVRTVSAASRRRSGPAISSSRPSPSRSPRSTAICRRASST